MWPTHVLVCTQGLLLGKLSAIKAWWFFLFWGGFPTLFYFPSLFTDFSQTQKCVQQEKVVSLCWPYSFEVWKFLPVRIVNSFFFFCSCCFLALLYLLDGMGGNSKWYIHVCFQTVAVDFNFRRRQGFKPCLGLFASLWTNVHILLCALLLNITLFLSFKESEPKPCYRVKVNFSLSDGEDVYLPVHQPVEWRYHIPEEEIRFFYFKFS